jgi:hypothetical protein
MSPPKKRASNGVEDEDGTVYPPFPTRPFTTYNIFFQLERHYILQTNSKVATELPDNVDQGAADRPEKYSNIILPKDWYIVGANRKKRQHHVNHGIITFYELTKAISRNWRTCDDATKMYCRGLADEVMDQYKKEIAAYTKKYGEEATKAQRKKQRGKKKSKASAAVARRRKDNEDSDEEEDDVRIEQIGKADDYNLLRQYPLKKYAQPFPDSDFPDREDVAKEATIKSTHPPFGKKKGSPSESYNEEEDVKEAAIATTHRDRHDYSLDSSSISRQSSLDGFNILTGTEAAKAFSFDEDVGDTSATATKAQES